MVVLILLVVICGGEMFGVDLTTWNTILTYHPMAHVQILINACADKYVQKVSIRIRLSKIHVQSAHVDITKLNQVDRAVRHAHVGIIKIRLSKRVKTVVKVAAEAGFKSSLDRLVQKVVYFVHLDFTNIKIPQQVVYHAHKVSTCN
jgi:hypothetical protein